MSALSNVNDLRLVIDLSNHQSGLCLTAEGMQMAELKSAQSLNFAPVCSETQRAWIRPTAAQWAEAHSQIFPYSQLLIDICLNSQQVANDNETLTALTPLHAPCAHGIQQKQGEAP